MRFNGRQWPAAALTRADHSPRRLLPRVCCDPGRTPAPAWPESQCAVASAPRIAIRRGSNAVRNPPSACPVDARDVGPAPHKGCRVCAILRRARDEILDRSPGTEEPMNERDEFLRDRLQPDQHRNPAARPPGPHPRDHQGAPPPAFPRPQQRPAPPPSFPPPPSPRPPAQPPPAPARQRVAPPPPPRPAGAPPGPAPAPVIPPPAPEAGLTPAAGAELPDRGWRRILRLLTFGLVNLGPSPAQLEDAEFEAAIRTGFRGNHKVGVAG